MKIKYIISIVLSILIFIPPIIIHQILPEDEQWSSLDWMNLLYLIAFVESGIMFFIFSQYLNEKREDKQKESKHSQNIAHALEIMKDGEYGEHSKEIQFLIPYPHSEYIKNRRKTLHPTRKEINKFVDDLMNGKGQPDDEITLYEFVPLKQSPEAKFEWAMKHLKSYKEIKQKLEKSQTTYTEYVKFCKKNNSELKQYSNGYEQSNKKAEILFDEHKTIADKSISAIHELQKSLEKLYYELKDGGTVKGKCDICK